MTSVHCRAIGGLRGNNEKATTISRLVGFQAHIKEPVNRQHQEHDIDRWHQPFQGLRFCFEIMNRLSERRSGRILLTPDAAGFSKACWSAIRSSTALLGLSSAASMLLITVKNT